MTSADPIHTYSGFFFGGGGSGGPETEYVANFSLMHVYSASLHYPILVKAIDLVCPQAILPMGVTLFPSGTLCATNIPSINHNDTIFYSEMSEKHDGETFMSLRFTVFLDILV